MDMVYFPGEIFQLDIRKFFVNKIAPLEQTLCDAGMFQLLRLTKSRLGDNSRIVAEDLFVGWKVLLVYYCSSFNTDVLLFYEINF